MKEHPILFKGDMIKAILEDRKTMTRRPLKPQPQPCGNGVLRPLITDCPYGYLGDRLWVRETWRVGAWDEEENCIAVDYKADNSQRRKWLKVEDEEMFQRLWEQSSGEAEKAVGEGKIKILNRDIEEGQYSWEPGESPCRWRSSRFMPRWASRIILEITNIKVERVQEITEEDARKEGYPEGLTETGMKMMNGRSWFFEQWARIYGYHYDPKIWVWVIEFKRIKP